MIRLFNRAFSSERLKLVHIIFGRSRVNTLWAKRRKHDYKSLSIRLFRNWSKALFDNFNHLVTMLQNIRSNSFVSCNLLLLGALNSLVKRVKAQKRVFCKFTFLSYGIFVYY